MEKDSSLSELYPYFLVVFRRLYSIDLFSSVDKWASNNWKRVTNDPHFQLWFQTQFTEKNQAVSTSLLYNDFRKVTENSLATFIYKHSLLFDLKLRFPNFTNENNNNFFKHFNGKLLFLALITNGQSIPQELISSNLQFQSILDSAVNSWVTGLINYTNTLKELKKENKNKRTNRTAQQQTDLKYHDLHLILFKINDQIVNLIRNGNNYKQTIESLKLLIKFFHHKRNTKIENENENENENEKEKEKTKEKEKEKEKENEKEKEKENENENENEKDQEWQRNFEGEQNISKGAFGITKLTQPKNQTLLERKRKKFNYPTNNKRNKDQENQKKKFRVNEKNHNNNLQINQIQRIPSFVNNYLGEGLINLDEQPINFSDEDQAVHSSDEGEDIKLYKKYKANNLYNKSIVSDYFFQNEIALQSSSESASESEHEHEQGQGQEHEHEHEPESGSGSRSDLELESKKNEKTNNSRQEHKNKLKKIINNKDIHKSRNNINNGMGSNNNNNSKKAFNKEKYKYREGVYICFQPQFYDFAKDNNLYLFCLNTRNWFNCEEILISMINSSQTSNPLTIIQLSNFIYEIKEQQILNITYVLNKFSIPPESQCLVELQLLELFPTLLLKSKFGSVILDIHSLNRKVVFKNLLKSFQTITKNKSNLSIENFIQSLSYSSNDDDDDDFDENGNGKNIENSSGSDGGGINNNHLMESSTEENLSSEQAQSSEQSSEQSSGQSTETSSENNYMTNKRKILRKKRKKKKIPKYDWCKWHLFVQKQNFQIEKYHKKLQKFLQLIKSFSLEQYDTLLYKSKISLFIENYNNAFTEIEELLQNNNNDENENENEAETNEYKEEGNGDGNEINQEERILMEQTKKLIPKKSLIGPDICYAHTQAMYIIEFCKKFEKDCLLISHSIIGLANVERKIWESFSNPMELMNENKINSSMVMNFNHHYVYPNYSLISNGYLVLKPNSDNDLNKNKNLDRNENRFSFLNNNHNDINAINKNNDDDKINFGNNFNNYLKPKQLNIFTRSVKFKFPTIQSRINDLTNILKDYSQKPILSLIVKKSDFSVDPTSFLSFMYYGYLWKNNNLDMLNVFCFPSEQDNFNPIYNISKKIKNQISNTVLSEKLINDTLPPCKQNKRKDEIIRDEIKLINQNIRTLSSIFSGINLNYPVISTPVDCEQISEPYSNFKTIRLFLTLSEQHINSVQEYIFLKNDFQFFFRHSSRRRYLLSFSKCNSKSCSYCQKFKIKATNAFELLKFNENIMFSPTPSEIDRNHFMNFNEILKKNGKIKQPGLRELELRKREIKLEKDKLLKRQQEEQRVKQLLEQQIQQRQQSQLQEEQLEQHRQYQQQQQTRQKPKTQAKKKPNKKKKKKKSNEKKEYICTYINPETGETCNQSFPSTWLLRKHKLASKHRMKRRGRPKKKN
ncbi:retinitis pigmentosa 1-like 1 protein [Anaeramoeba flamelloides]|uniref:Retinitis pigmentosa 1-like 1 protein n=1 Tax=Anaeramoeba flamelloides TaxID=1746091 RepID=A0ABQ8Y2A9_9EUKA|nr:retinitis pigmentosa 1-like 1 protein [Anaeramoeba flamelloides]